MMMTRRFFVGSLTAMATAAGLGMGSVFVTRRKLTMAEIVPTTVLPLQGQPISLRNSEGQFFAGIIEEVTSTQQAAQPGAPGMEQLSLLVAPENKEAPTGIYHVTTDELDLGALHFMPVGGTGRQQRLEAVINRIV